MSQQKIMCMVVDDDEIDRLTTVSFLREYSFMDIIGVFDSPTKALEAAKVNPPQVMFLDVDMPGMSGLQLREQLLHIPACVFITSYPDYAVESFELAALDFLVKPHNHDRFAKTIERIQSYMSIVAKSELLEHTIGADTVFIKEGTQQVKLQLHEVSYLEAMKDYTSIVTAARKYTVLSPLGTLLKEGAFKNFIRVHRSFAVQKHFIQEIRTSEVVLNTHVKLPVGRNFKDALKNIG